MATIAESTSQSYGPLQPNLLHSQFATATRVHHQVGGRGYVVSQNLQAAHSLFPALRFWNLGTRTVSESDYAAFRKTGVLPSSKRSTLNEDLVARALREADAVPLPLALKGNSTGDSSSCKHLATRVQVHHKPGSQDLVLRTTEVATHPGLPAPLTIERQQRPLTDEEFQKLLAEPSPPQEDPDVVFQRFLAEKPSRDIVTDEEFQKLLAEPSPPQEDPDVVFQKVLEPPPSAQRKAEDHSFDFASWALETGLWDGRPVSWENAGEFQKNLEQRIAILLLTEDPQDLQYQKLVAGLACAGVLPGNRDSLAKDLQDLGLSPNGSIIQVGLWKDIGKFCKKYKTEILVGLAVIAVVTVVVVVAVSTGGAASGAAAAGGGALIDGLNQALDEPPSKPAEPPKVEDATEPPPQEVTAPPEPSIPIPDLPPKPLPGKPIYLENGVLLDGEFFSYTDLLTRLSVENAFAMKEDPLPPQMTTPLEVTTPPLPGARDLSLSRRFFEAIGRGVIADLSSDSDLCPPRAQETSRSFRTVGSIFAHLGVGGVNGINTSFNEALGHANYINSFASNLSIEWVYNHSNGFIGDVAEIAAANLYGFSPKTAGLLRDNWLAFHNANKDRPHAKYLQFCHSQGGFHTRNALASCPKEIRDRVIVVNLGAATIIPDDVCFKSYNYASQTDLVRFGEIGLLGLWDSSEVGMSARLEQVLKEREDIILLPPLPDQIGMGHGFQDPTLKKAIGDHIMEYLNRNGEYK